MPLLIAALGTAGWAARAQLLPVLGTLLVVEDPVAPVEVIIISTAAARADTLEAAALYHAGVSRRIMIPLWQMEPLDVEVRRLGVPWLPPTDLALAILERRDVPRNAIEVLAEPVDGLNAEIASIGQYAATHPPQSILFVTARSHTRRASWLLRRVLPAETAITVRASRNDAFDPRTWWHSRDGSREVAMEYLRWANTFGLRDLWSKTPPSVPEG